MQYIRDYLARLNLTASINAAPDPAPITTPDCEPWCAGTGRRRLGAAVTEGVTDRVIPYLDLMRSVRFEYCPCDAGQHAQALHAKALAALEAQERQREADQLWGASNLPPKLRRCSFDSYLAQVPGASETTVSRLRCYQAAMRADGRWLLLHGATGTCKTGHAAALLNEDLAAGRSGLYVVVPNLILRLHEAVRGGASREESAASVLALLRPLFRVGLLVLDDLGTLDERDQVELPSKFVRDQLFAIVNERDLWDLPTIITTNLDETQLEAYLGERTFDRVRGRCDIEGQESFSLKVGGTSRRGLVALQAPSQAGA